MRKMKFRAVIPEKNAIIYFTLQDLVDPNPLFSIRELLIPWLRAGNRPDRYIGQKDRFGKEIYERDILKWKWNKMEEEIFIVTEENIAKKRKDWYMRRIGHWEIPSIAEVIGNIYETPQLLPKLEEALGIKHKTEL